MTKRNRPIAWVLALTFVFVMLFSVCFVIAEADHDCTGEDCPICCQISICENTRRVIGLIAAAVFFFVPMGLFTVAMPALATEQAHTPSLVSLKVKLSN